MSTCRNGPNNDKGQRGENQRKGAIPNEDTSDDSSRGEFNNAVAIGGLAAWIAILHINEKGEESEEDTYEVTMQELLRDYVVKGFVDKIKIVNRSVCVAYLHSDVGSIHGQPQRLSVQLDTVKKFEDKIEQTQRQLGVHMSAFIPVHYANNQSSESDHASRVVTSLIIVIPYFILSLFL